MRKIGLKEYREIYDDISMSMTKKYSTEQAYVSVEGIPIATACNFSASVGKSKSKKTFNVSAIAAAALSDHEVLKYQATLPQGKNKVLYVDTEQSPIHIQRVMKRIAKMAGLPEDAELENAIFFRVRDYTPENRVDIIENALFENPDIGLLIIDGARELLHDFNNPTESMDLINKFMEWSGKYGLHIHTALHVNKQDDNTRGHLGSELNNKAETVILVTKVPDNSSRSNVKVLHARDVEFKPFTFEVGDDGVPYIIEKTDADNYSKRNRGFRDFRKEQHCQALEFAFKGNSSYGYQKTLEALEKGYETIGYKRKRNTMVELCKYLQDCGALKKIDKEYIYNADFDL